MKHLITMLAVLAFTTQGVFGFMIPPRLAEELELSSKQEEELDQMGLKFQKERESMRLDIEETHIALKRELLKDEPDMAKLKSLIEKKASQEAAMEYHSIESLFKLKGILSDTQFEKVRGFMKTMGEHRRMMGGEGEPRGDMKGAPMMRDTKGGNPQSSKRR